MLRWSRFSPVRPIPGWLLLFEGVDTHSMQHHAAAPSSFVPSNTAVYQNARIVRLFLLLFLWLEHFREHAVDAVDDQATTKTFVHIHTPVSNKWQE